MAPQPAPSEPATIRRDYTAIVLVGLLGLVEIAILYVLIAVDTPVTPLVRALLRNPFGVFTLVMAVVVLLCFSMVGILSWAEWAHKRRLRAGRAA